MLKRVVSNISGLRTAFLFLILVIVFASGCAVSAKNADGTVEGEKPLAEKKADVAALPAVENAPLKGRIKITAGGAADTVRLFYKNLRERRFREAMLLTNLRAAVEGLTDAEVKDLEPDFEPLAQQVPENLEINGEIITNNQATVTAKLPNDESGTLELKEIPLRMEKDAWVIITADDKAEAMARKEGKNYFFALRMDIHHSEAQYMMERISKAQTVYAIQNGGTFASLDILVGQGLLPDDIKTTRSTGYVFTIVVTDNATKYFASAVPEVYGKSGKMSYLLETFGNDRKSRLKFEDNKGQPLKKP